MTFPAPLESQLRAAITASLENYAISNACFLSERLYYESKSEDTLNLYCECLFHENRFFKIYLLLKRTESLKNQYLYGVTCLKLGRNEEAQTAFQKCVKGEYNTSFSIYMLGQCYEKQQNFKEAGKCFLAAIEKNQTIWMAYEKLCRLGGSISPKIFSDGKMNKSSTESEQDKQSFNFLNYRKKISLKNSSNETFYDRKCENINLFRARNDYNKEPISSQNIQSQKRLTGTCSSVDFTIGFDTNLTLNSHTLLQTNPNPQEKSVIPNIVSFLNLFANPFYFLCKFQTKEALSQLLAFPLRHLDSGWVQFQIAKCYLEMRNYSLAEIHFKKTLDLEPYNIESMAYFSSCLWQLRKKKDLVFLSHNALELTKLESDVWVVAGNCLSLENDHENAVKFLQRSIQIKPENSYAHCLCGLEYSYLEDFAAAKRSFELSLCYDKRNYNAWWGLGTLYFKSEKYERAIEFFQKAISINPKNSILFSFLGMAFNSRRSFGDALKSFDASLTIDEKNHLARFQRANALFQVEQFDLALGELEKLRVVLPHESAVVIMMSKIYNKLGNPEKANSYMNLAIDLEPADSQQIKEASGFSDFSLY